MKKPAIYLILILCFPGSHTFAQYQDIESWWSATIKKRLYDKTDFSVEQMLRLNENATSFQQTFTDVGLKHELFDNFLVSGNYRLIIKEALVTQRLYAALEYRYRWKNWKAEPRLRVEHTFVPNDFDENYVRPKLTISNKLNKRFEPFVAGELFYKVWYYKGDVFDQYRISGGTEYKFNNSHSLECYYIFEQEMNVNEAEQTHIFGIGYKYILPR